MRISLNSPPARALAAAHPPESVPVPGAATHGLAWARRRTDRPVSGAAR
ncbi:hypothetical protein FHU36_000194 [Nonomuraea muscovyensis]|uniref:Uncharacterized protein n=1 Tax=Nonomuraea muscovyensis TaxID=1124761 RepID=A0A7X0EWD1_9ACTN|nr:hypothetical protein [Nonomuraea muscovyensis]